MMILFMNSENNKASELNRLLLSLSDKIDLKRRHKYVASSNLIVYSTWKNIKSLIKTITLEYHPQHGKKNLIYLMNDYIL